MDLEDILHKSSSYADSQDLQIPDTRTEKEQLSQYINTSNLKNNTNVIENENLKVDTNQNLYEEILDKLDIKPRENKKVNQEQVLKKEITEEDYLQKFKDLQENKAKPQLEKVLAQDFAKIQKLVKGGLISSGQGQNLKKQVLKKAFDKLVQTEKIKRALKSLSGTTKSLDNKTGNDFEKFSQDNPNFFDSNGRKEVLSYLKSGKVKLGKDELNQISNIVRIVEKAAIDRYLQKEAHEKSLRSSNDNAKQRLTANAQKSVFGENLSRSFTREQIGKMSSTEFAKYESLIMEQLKKGQIK